MANFHRKSDVKNFKLIRTKIVQKKSISSASKNRPLSSGAENEQNHGKFHSKVQPNSINRQLQSENKSPSSNYSVESVSSSDDVSNHIDYGSKSEIIENSSKIQATYSKKQENQFQPDKAPNLIKDKPSQIGVVGGEEAKKRFDTNKSVDSASLAFKGNIVGKDKKFSYSKTGNSFVTNRRINSSNSGRNYGQQRQEKSNNYRRKDSTIAQPRTMREKLAQEKEVDVYDKKLRKVIVKTKKAKTFRVGKLSVSNKVMRQGTYSRIKLSKKAIKKKQLTRRNFAKRSKRQYLVSSKAYKEAKIDYKINKNNGILYQSVSKEDLLKARNSKKMDKRVLDKAIQMNGGTRPQRIRRFAKQSLQAQGISSFKAAAQDDSVLGEAAELHSKYVQTKGNVRYAKTTGKYGYRVGKLGVKVVSYPVRKPVEVAYKSAYVKKFGKYPDPIKQQVKDFSKGQALKVKNKASNAAKRPVASTKKAASKAKEFISSAIKKTLQAVVKTKATIVVAIAGGFFLILMAFAVILGGGIQQDDRDLNDAWLFICQLDRKNSNDEVEYYSNIDDILLYMNYKYGNFTQDSKFDWHFSDGETKEKKAKEIEELIWKDLNGNTSAIKMMSDLYGQKKNPYKVTDSEIQEMKDLRENGNYLALQELENPLYAKSDANYENPLRVSQRYGYDSKSHVNEDMTFVASASDSVYAVRSGKVTVHSNKDVTIESKTSKFTYRSLSNIRVKTGDEIKSGDIVGQVEGDNLSVNFQKKFMRAWVFTDWVSLNPAFYFPSIEYLQFTQVKTNFSPGEGEAQRAQEVIDLIKQHYPEATNQGLAAFLGNWSIESSINAKSAEADYLSPPIGASAPDSPQWDDPNWLNLGNLEIYGGLYPNIVRRGLGLGQWTDTADGAIRNTTLRAFADGKGKKWYDPSLQIDFMFNGDEPYYSATVKRILSMTDSPSVLAIDVLDNWERNPGDKMFERQASAENWYQFIIQPPASQSVEKLLSQVGVSFGSGQCFSLSSQYVYMVTDGKYSIGAGIGSATPPVLGDTMAAQNIGSSYDWGAIGWTVTHNPTKFSDIRVGDIINYKMTGDYTSSPAGDPIYGHTAVVTAILGTNQYQIISQNPGPAQLMTLNFSPNGITSLVHPPK